MLSYIELINRFWQVDEAGSFSGNETRLYFYLLKVANKASWPAEFEHADKKTEGNVGLSKGTLKKCRDRLVEVGLLSFTEGGHGQGAKVRYQLRYQKLTPNLTPKPPVRCQKITPNLTPKLDFSAGLVSVKVSKFNTYTIYKRLKTVYTLTKKSVREQLGKFLAAKKKVRSRPVIRRIKPEPTIRRADPFTIKTDAETLNVPYSIWKVLYAIDGNETQLRKLWLDLSDAERTLALSHTPDYMQSAPERFLKSPANYLAEKQFNNRIINRHDKSAANAPATPAVGSAQFGQGAVLGAGTNYQPQRIGRRHQPGDGPADSRSSGGV